MMGLHLGIVESRKDPLALGRVQVRVFGVHTDSKIENEGIPTEMLSWSTVMTPTTGSSMSGIGINPNIVEGTMVVVMFNDESYQECIVLGTVPGLNQTYLYKVAGVDVPRADPLVGFQDPQYHERGWYPWEEYTGGTDKLGESNGKSDLAFGSVEEQFELGFERYDDPEEKNPLFTFQEPEDLRKYHKYPHNQVRQSERGHFEEWDDTYGNERLNKQHRSGTFEEIRPDGTRVQKIVNEDYTIISTNQYVHIKATNPHPRNLQDNLQEPYTADMWDWSVKNETTDTSEFGQPPSDPDKFGRHVHVEGVDDLYVRRNRNVWVEGNTNTVVMGNDDVQILGNKGQNVTIKGDQTVNIGGSQDVTIQADQAESVEGKKDVDVTGTHTESIGGNQNIHILGNQNMTVGGNQQIDIAGTQTTTISGDQKMTVVGAQEINISDTGGAENAQAISISGNQSLAVSGDQNVTISGNQNVGIDESQSININNGDQRITIAEGNQKIQVLDGYQTMTVNGQQYITATGGQNFNVTDGIQTFTVNGDQIMNISGTQSVIVAAGGNQKFDVTAGSQEFSVIGNQTFSVSGTQNILCTGAQAIAVNGIQTIDVTGAQIMNIGAAQTITVGGACAITAGGAAVVTAPTVTLTSALTTMTGNVVVGGTLTAAGVITGADVLSVAGTSLTTHTHTAPGSDGPPAPTTPPL